MHNCQNYVDLFTNNVMDQDGKNMLSTYVYS